MPFFSLYGFHCFSRYCSFSLFRPKANLRMNSAQVFIPFYEWRNWGSVQVTPPEGLASPVPVGVGPDILHSQRWVGGWEGEYSDKCPALSFLRMPAGTSCHSVDDAHRVFYGGTCSSLKGSPGYHHVQPCWEPGGQSWDHSQATQLLFLREASGWPSTWIVCLALYLVCDLVSQLYSLPFHLSS